MGILFRYILREVLVTSLIGTLLFTFVLFLRLIDPLMELLIRPGASTGDVFYLLALTVPEALRLTVPIGVLVGVLVGLGRLSTDGEITALRAAGVPGRFCTRPISAFALFGALICAVITLWVNPIAKREIKRIAESFKISQATAEVQPRVFIERFSDVVVWVEDIVSSGAAVQWKGVFIADMRAPSDRGSFTGVNAAVDGPRITVAEEAIVIPRPEQNRLQVHLPHASTYEQSFDPTQYHSFEFFDSDQVLETPPATVGRIGRPFEERSTAGLLNFRGEPEDQTAAAIELQQRLALPFACLVLPMVGIPLAVSAQRATRSLGVIFSIVLVFIYYMIQLGGIALAERELLPVAPAVWLANAVFALVGGLLLAQLDRPNRRDITAAVTGRLRSWIDRLRRVGASASGKKRLPLMGDGSGNGRSRRRSQSSPGPGAATLPAFPIVDRYVLSTFLFYFAVLVSAFVMIWCVFSFFELLNDMLARDKMALFVPYVYYLTPFLLYKTAPLGILVATLVSFGILAKHHELTAFKACGVSLYRLAAPVLVCALALSGLLFALDHYYLPVTNRKQDAIRDEIKGRPVRTFLRPDRQWTYGLRDRVFFHRFFDSANRVLVGVNVFDFASEHFSLQRHISAKRAVWDPGRRAWVFKDGWIREVDGSRVTSFEPFESRVFPGLEEAPGYFLKEVRQHQQMNWPELRDYIVDLTQSGFNTVRLQVELHRKLAFPLFAFVIAVLAIPFSFLADHRGALTGVALGIGLAIAYYSITALFEQLGRASQLTPVMAAWAPSVLFGLSGTYMFLRVRS